MMRIFKAIVEHFGFSGIHKLIENPIATYTPCSQSALRFDVEGKDIDLSVEFRFKGSAKGKLDEALAEGKRLRAKKISLTDEDFIDNFDEDLVSDVRFYLRRLRYEIDRKERLYRDMAEAEAEAEAGEPQNGNVVSLGPRDNGDATGS